MAYGITVDGSGGIFGIDSNTGTTRHFGVKVLPNDIAANSTITGWDRGNGDLIFARPQSTTTGTDETNNYLGLKVASGNYSFNVAANYMVVQTAQRAILNNDSLVNGNNYGIQINNSAATPITILDSRRFNAGLEFLKIYDPGYFAGGLGGSTNWTSSNLVYQATSTSTLQGVYVCVNTSQFSVSQGHFNMYYYNFSNYGIYFHSFIQGSPVSGPSTAIKNSTAVIVGAFKGNLP